MTLRADDSRHPDSAGCTPFAGLTAESTARRASGGTSGLGEAPSMTVPVMVLGTES